VTDDRLNTIRKKIRRLKWGEPHHLAKPRIIELMKERIRILKDRGESTKSYLSEMSEYEDKPPFKRSSQPKRRTRWQQRV